MLIDFEVGNFLSFNRPVRLSMLASNADKELLESNTFEAGGLRLLRSAVIYGANASGKSNLLNAMSFMRWFVLSSSKETQAAEEIRVTPFKLDVATETAPSHFEVCFLMDNRRYRYGFEATRKAIAREWLFCAERLKEEPLFRRSGDGIEVSDGFADGIGLEEKTRDNALFLSVVAQFNGKLATSILEWFMGFRTVHGLQDEHYESFTAQLMQNEGTRGLILRLIQFADVGIEDLIVDEISDSSASKIGYSAGLVTTTPPPKVLRVSTVHSKFRGDVKEGRVTLDLMSEESEGTKKFFRIAGPLIDCVVNGYVVCIDELDAKLHPLLTRAIAGFFMGPIQTKRPPQLIFATHDTNILDRTLMRRDQIWFTEKNRQSATDLYSLAEFRAGDGQKVRNDADYESNYIKGRYGAIPYLGDAKTLLKELEHGTPHQD